MTMRNTPRNTTPILLSLCVAMAACTEPEDHALSNPYPHRIELVGFEGCPNTPVLRENLRRALEAERWAPRFIEVDLTTLDASDPRRGFAAPSILVEGRDIMGNPPSDTGGIGCRVYPGGVPTAEQLAKHLRAGAAR